jgi:hypothetical protein
MPLVTLALDLKEGISASTPVVLEMSDIPLFTPAARFFDTGS